jgi:tRNA pseudouridine65 synthase
MSQEIPILYRDSDLVVVDKPSGYHVHQPEMKRRRVPKEQTMLYLVRELVGEYLYPIHRLDVGTSGVLIFALNKETASLLGRVITSGETEKQYIAIVRGYLRDAGEIDVPLESDTTGEMWEAHTRYTCVSKTELSHAVGKRHATARYSLAHAWIGTGRFHQIRRHFARIAHPIVGDRVHGDSHHNRFFRETLELPGLWLRAEKFSFVDPRIGERREFKAPLPEKWRSAINKIGFGI